jgi:4'-phosphopantetheinyl transferase
VYSDYGKPFLAPESNHPGFSFNLSHAAGLALYAVTYNQDVGIDVEHIRTDIEYEEIAQQFFSPGEVAVLRTVPDPLKPLAFFNCWTRKEAYIKAQGQGLSLPLDRFDVSLVPGEPAQLLTNLDDPQAVSRWSLQELTPGLGYVGAVAVRRRGFGCQFWQWVHDFAGVVPVPAP